MPSPTRARWFGRRCGTSWPYSVLSGDPMFWSEKTGPDYYMLRWTASPSYLTNSTGRNRGAYQNTAPGRGTVVMFR